MQIDNFWLVWNEEGHAPTHKHDSFENARAEATRLAGLNPGQTFHVLGLCGSARKIDVQWITPYIGDEIPF